MNEELKLCPFCGGTDLEIVSPAAVIPTDYIVCETCDASGPMAKSGAGAERLWNTRPREADDD